MRIVIYIDIDLVDLNTKKFPVKITLSSLEKIQWSINFQFCVYVS